MEPSSRTATNREGSNASDTTRSQSRPRAPASCAKLTSANESGNFLSGSGNRNSN